jgi:hypothetical protein
MSKTQEQLDEEMLAALLPTINDMFSRMFPSKMFCEAEDAELFRSVVPSYKQLEQEVRSLYDEAAFYKKELEDALRLVEKLKKELGHE